MGFEPARREHTGIDTEEVIHGGRDAVGASNRDRQMILNHKAAIEFLVENAADIAFDRYTLMSLHGLLAENLLQNRDDEGRLRTSPVTIGASLFTPTAIPQVIDERFNALLHTAAAIVDPMEQSFFAMVHLPYLQPFIDVNKRTSRLAANIPLIKANLCPLSFVDVPETLYAQGTLAVYELRDVSLLRDVFAWAYESEIFSAVDGRWNNLWPHSLRESVLLGTKRSWSTGHWCGRPNWRPESRARGRWRSVGGRAVESGGDSIRKGLRAHRGWPCVLLGEQHGIGSWRADR